MRNPSIGYPGGKARMAKLITSLFPPSGRMFVEPFAGHGNVFWTAANTLNYQEWWLNDINTAPLFEAIREIGNTVEIPPRSKEEYYLQWEAYKQGDLRAKILQPYLTFGGGGYGAAGPGGGKGSSQAGYTKTIRACYEIIHRTQVRITDFDYVAMGLENLTEDCTVYCDPPYKQADVRAYKPGTLDFNQLVGILKAAKFKWVLSEFYDPIYVEAFGEPCIKKDMQLTSTNFHVNGGGGKATRTECLWKNF